MVQTFAQPNAAPWVEVAPGNRRRVLVHTPELMLVEFAFAEGAIGALQRPPARAGKPCRRRPLRGDHRRPDRSDRRGRQLHRAVGPAARRAGAGAGRLIDSFTPARLDFLLSGAQSTSSADRGWAAGARAETVGPRPPRPAPRAAFSPEGEVVLWHGRSASSPLPLGERSDCICNPGEGASTTRIRSPYQRRNSALTFSIYAVSCDVWLLFMS